MTETTSDPGTPTTEVTLGSRTLNVPAGGLFDRYRMQVGGCLGSHPRGGARRF